jgi:sulfur carrier protein ThiS
MSAEQGLTIRVALHTVLEQYSPALNRGAFALTVARGSTIRGVLKRLGIKAPVESLILVINHHVVEPGTTLSDGDQLDIIPAISGG